MNIEEKAKAYDEALERAKNIKSKILQSHLSTESCKAVSEYIDEIIPELRESEDERIREQLINICNEWLNGGWSARPCLNDIKWLKNLLEKKKEQKPKEDKYQQELEATDRWQEGYEAGFNAASKPAEWSEEDETRLTNILIMLKEYAIRYYSKDDVNKSVDWLKNKVKFLRQVKQDWSEEDEKMVRFYEDDYDNNLGNMPMSDVIENRIKFKDWLLNRLKSLRPQPHWKKSLATADLENSLCDLQDNYHDGSYEYKVLGEAIEFIRCTEPRPSWKPSEEQMEELKEVSTLMACNDDHIAFPSLKSLYEQLKKL